MRVHSMLVSCLLDRALQILALISMIVAYCRQVVEREQPASRAWAARAVLAAGREDKKKKKNSGANLRGMAARWASRTRAAHLLLSLPVDALSYICLCAGPAAQQVLVYRCDWLHSRGFVIRIHECALAGGGARHDDRRKSDGWL